MAREIAQLTIQWNPNDGNLAIGQQGFADNAEVLSVLNASLNTCVMQVLATAKDKILLVTANSMPPLPRTN